MTAPKVLITYKRRRNLEGADMLQENGHPDTPEGDIPQENGHPDPTVDPSSDKASNISDKHEELAEGNTSEDPEHGPNVKRLCTGSTEQKNHINSGQESSRENQLVTCLHSEEQSHASQGGSCSNLFPSSARGDNSVGDYSAVPPLDLNLISEPDPVIASNGISCLKKNALKWKSTSPVITFCRRSKQKKDDNHPVPFEKCISAASANGQKVVSNKNCSVQAPKNLSPPENNINSANASKSCQEQITNKYVNNTSASTNLVPEIGSQEQPKKEPGSTSKDHPCASEEALPQDSVSNQSLQTKIGGELRETPTDTRNSLDNAEAGPSREPVIPTCNESVAEKSQSSANGDLNTTRVTDANVCGKSTRPLLDLFVPPPHDFPVGMDCNIASQPHVEEKHVRSLPETRTRDSMELFCENVEFEGAKKQKYSSQPAQERRNGSSSKQVVGSKNNNSAKSSQVLALENNCLQLFPEDRAVNRSSGKATAVNKSSGMATACADSRGKLLSLQPSSSRWKTTADKTSRFVPPAMLMEPLVASQAGGSTTPQWENLGIQPRFLGEEGIAPEHTSSYLRQRAILDSFASNRGRAGSGNRSNLIDRIDLRWSEDELDYLWIGVRRHGQGNWESILKDRKLHFFPCRTARDLSERWEVEQSKLFCSSSFLPSKPQVVGVDPLNRSRFSFAMNDPSNVPARQLHDSDANTRATHIVNEISRRSLFVNRPSDAGPSQSANPTPPMDVKLPHWLKEVVADPPKPSPSTAPPSGTLSIRCSEAQWTIQPSLDPSGSHQGSRNGVTLNRGLPDSGELLNMTGTLNANAERRENNVRDLNLIVIDDDASSEETISDHRAGGA